MKVEGWWGMVRPPLQFFFSFSNKVMVILVVLKKSTMSHVGHDTSFASLLHFSLTGDYAINTS